MGKVVEFETPRTESRGARTKRSRRRRSKTALVLGGGGFTGGVYEIGALRALDLLAVNRTINEFDVYVGTSAGAFVASMVANGITPEEMMRVINRDLPSPLSDIDLGTLLQPNYGGFVRKSITFPLRVAGVAREFLSHIGEISAVDVVNGLAGGLPTGIYSGRGIEHYVEEALSDPDRTNDFRLLNAELYITATDLDSTDRIVMGEGEWMDVPISTAVAASGALPMIYEPVRVNGREFIDGGIRSTTNIDVAVEHGAKFIVVVNPVVPFVNDFRKRIPTVMGTRARRISDMGFTAIGNQAFRLLSHERLHIAVQHWQERYPGVDIILIEPELDDEVMFGTSILDYSARLEIAARRVRHVLDQVEREREPQSAWRRVLEQTTAALLRTQRQDDEASEEA